MSAPYALTVRGPSELIFALSDRLGFEADMQALAVSIFEDGPEQMRVEALYATLLEADRALADLDLSPTVEGFIAQLPDEDWVSKSQAGLPPVEAGRFWVHGSHDADTAPDHVMHPICIDAGLAFGTGHHGTTKGCLIIFDDLLTRGWEPQAVLDLGCGAGTLAIAAAKALDHAVLASDIDPEAVVVTRDNATANGVGDKVRAVEADGFDDPDLRGQSFDLIFANILAGPLMGLAPNICAALCLGGQAILSGILDEQAGNVSDAFEQVGLSVKRYPSISGWTSLLATKN